MSFTDMSESPTEEDNTYNNQDEADTTAAQMPSKEGKENSYNADVQSPDSGYLDWSAGRDMNFISGNDLAESMANIWNQGLMAGEGGEILRSVPFWRNPIALVSGAVIIGSIYYLVKKD
jgi:hypothetical protein